MGGIRHFFAAAWVLLAAGAAAGAGEAAREAILPPPPAWSGASRALVATPDDPWITPAERDAWKRTPSYAETMAWLARLDAAAPQISRVTLGKTPEGRDIVLVVASREGAATPQELRANGRPTLFAQAGIHAGEIDGKDAALMLLRDLTVRGTKRALLERANFLLVPILNADGHERSSEFSRINQRGPENGGWRTNSRNLNLNRDYTKLDAPETRAMVQALNAWTPDLYVDLHVTDGADYQYDVTYGWVGEWGHSPAIARWLSAHLGPNLQSDLRTAGHLPGPLVFYADDAAPEKGLVEWTPGPRFSNGYGDLRHLPTVLVENHSLKPYRQRVLGNYVFLESALASLADHSDGLRAAVAEDGARRRMEVPLDWRAVDGTTGGAAVDVASEPTLRRLAELQGKSPTIEIEAVASRVETSPVSGGAVVRWLGEPRRDILPLVRHSQPATTARRPAAYWIPPAHAEVIERLRLHGVQIEVSTVPREVDVEMYRLAAPQLAAEVFEGHVRLTAAANLEPNRLVMAAGAVRVPTDQPLGDLAMLLLEPASPDSFFQWGFFLECLQPTEYAEAYVIEPMARAMLEQDPALRAEFEAALAADPAFAADPRARLDWFYRRTPFFDQRALLYPVAREP